MLHYVYLLIPLPKPAHRGTSDVPSTGTTASPPQQGPPAVLTAPVRYLPDTWVPCTRSGRGTGRSARYSRSCRGHTGRAGCSRGRTWWVGSLERGQRGAQAAPGAEQRCRCPAVPRWAAGRAECGRGHRGLFASAPPRCSRALVTPGSGASQGVPSAVEPQPFDPGELNPRALEAESTFAFRSDYK